MPLDDFQEDNYTPKPPPFLTFLCVLSLIGSLMGVSLNIAFYGAMKETAMETLDFSRLGIAWNVVAVGIIADIFGAIGVVLMYQLRTAGFVTYFFACLAQPVFVLLNPKMYRMSHADAVTLLVISAIFICLYAFYLRKMRW